MALDPTTPRSRRAMLAAAAAAAAATVANAALRPLPAAAAGDVGAVIHVGDLFANAQAQTTIGNQVNDDIVLWVASNGDLGHGSGTAVVGYSAHGTGVEGKSNGDGVGVRGTSTSSSGIEGRSTSSSGVFGGSASSTGVFGSSTSGDGVLGASTSSFGVHGSSLSGTGVGGFNGASDRAASEGWSLGSGTGILGFSSDGTGVLPVARAHTGVMGVASTTGTGVHAESPSGNALRVEGKASFSRSGRASVAKRRSYVDVSVAGGLTSSASVLATLQTLRSGVYVAAVRTNFPSAGKARIYLNKVASLTATSPVAWFVFG